MRRHAGRAHRWMMGWPLRWYLGRHTRGVLHTRMRHLWWRPVLREEGRIDVRRRTLRRALGSTWRSTHRWWSSRTHVGTLHVRRTLVGRESLLHWWSVPVGTHGTRLWTLLRHATWWHLTLGWPLEHRWPRRSLSRGRSTRSHVRTHIRRHIVRRSVEPWSIPLRLWLESRRLPLRGSIVPRRGALHTWASWVHGSAHWSIHRHATTEILMRTWGKVIVRMAGMLGPRIVIRGSRSGFRLTFKVT